MRKQFQSPVRPAVVDSSPLTPAVPQYVSVAQELAALVQDHPYLPGDRLPTLSALARKFSVGRKVVQRAVAELVGQGVLTARQGSGIYVSTGGEAAPKRAPADVAARGAALADWQVPLPAVSTRPRLTLHLNDVGPAADRVSASPLDAAWQDLVSAFNQEQRASLEILPGAPARINAAAPEAFAGCDLMQIHSAHLHRFVRAEALLPATAYVPELHASLAPFPEWACCGVAVHGAPWAVPTVGGFGSLFLNETLAVECGFPVESFQALDFAAYLDGLAELAARRLPGAPALAISDSGFLHYLISSGAVDPRRPGLLQSLPRAACLAFLARHEPALRNPQALDLEPTRSLAASGFPAGGRLFMDGASFYRIALRGRVDFPWRMIPFPRRVGAPAVFTCNLLGAHRATACPDVAAAFLAFIARPESQARLAAAGRLVLHPEALPALAATYEEGEGFAQLRQALAHGHLFSFATPADLELYAFVERQYGRWRRGELTADGLLDLIGLHCQCLEEGN